MTGSLPGPKKYVVVIRGVPLASKRVQLPEHRLLRFDVYARLPSGLRTAISSCFGGERETDERKAFAVYV